MSEQHSVDNDPQAPFGSEPGFFARWLKRLAVAPVLMAAGLFGLFQGFFFTWRLIVGSPGVGLRTGFFLGVVTLLLLAPAILLLRVLHPAWRRGERLRAEWAVSSGVAAALASWMIADSWTTAMSVPETVSPWLEAVAALAIAYRASRIALPPRMIRTGAIATAVLFALSLLSIGWPGSPPPTEEKAAASADAPDVVLVSIDTLRADRFGVYGRSPSLTPEMDRIAGEGARCDRALADAPWTLPSVASLMTGLPSTRHGTGHVRNAAHNSDRSPLDQRFTTLAERFQAAGYRTCAVVTNVSYLNPEMGMAQGFENYENPDQRFFMLMRHREAPLVRLALALIPAEKVADYRAEALTTRALEWLSKEDERPLFLWVHYIDPHGPYEADPRKLDFFSPYYGDQPGPGEDGGLIGDRFLWMTVRRGRMRPGLDDLARVQEYYDRGVSYVDEQVGRLFGGLRERDAGRGVVAAVTADHGEEFLEHGQFEHGHDYYREVTWVPLFFWGPARVPAATVVDDVVGLVDVAPTLLELAGLEPPAPEAVDEGRSLVPLWSGEEAEPRIAVPRFSGNNLFGLTSVLVEEGRWRYILRANGAEELYDVTLDPGERQNRALEQPELAARFHGMLEPRLKIFLVNSSDDESEMSQDAKNALKALGYVD